MRADADRRFVIAGSTAFVNVVHHKSVVCYAGP